MSIRSPANRLRSLEALAENLTGRLRMTSGEDAEIVEAHLQAVQWAIANLRPVAEAEALQMAEHRAFLKPVDRFAENWRNALRHYHGDGGHRVDMGAVACYARAAVQCVGKVWPGAADEVLELIQRRTHLEPARFIIAQRSTQQ